MMMKKMYNSTLDITIILFIFIVGVICDDNMALLSGTLRTYTRSGCDHEPIALSCPRGTSISIEVAQYLNNEQHSCEASTTQNLTQEGVVNAGTEIEIKVPEKCSWPNVLSYSLLQTVVEACQKKRHCKFLSTPKTFQGDPCPGVKKFVEITYKCRPYEFRSKVACENDQMQLMCNPYSRIAIYGASYGRSEYESLQCAQPHGVKEESKTCLVSYSTETVMRICHGQRKCSLTADSTTFGKPCRPDTRMYLKVVYTCVPRKVLKDNYETPPEPDEPHQNDIDSDHDELYDDDQFYKESEAIPQGPAPKLQGDIVAKDRPVDIPSIPAIQSSSVRPPLRARDESPLEEHHERYYLYLIISVTIGVLLCLIIVTGRIIIQKQREEREEQGKDEPKFQKSNTGETTITKEMSRDNMSDIEGGDIDLTTPIPLTNLPTKSEKSAFTTYTPPPGPYVSIVPTSMPHPTTAMMMRPPPPAASIMGQKSIIIGPGSSNNPSILAQSPSNLANLQIRTLPRQHIGVNRNLSVGSDGGLVSVIQPQYLGGSIMGHHTLRRPTQSGIETVTVPSSTATFYTTRNPAIAINTSQHQQFYYG